MEVGGVCQSLTNIKKTQARDQARHSQHAQEQANAAADDTEYEARLLIAYGKPDAG